MSSVEYKISVEGYLGEVDLISRMGVFKSRFRDRDNHATSLDANVAAASQGAGVAQ